MTEEELAQLEAGDHVTWTIGVQRCFGLVSKVEGDDLWAYWGDSPGQAAGRWDQEAYNQSVYPKHCTAGWPDDSTPQNETPPVALIQPRGEPACTCPDRVLAWTGHERTCAWIAWKRNQ